MEMPCCTRASFILGRSRENDLAPPSVKVRRWAFSEFCFSARGDLGSVSLMAFSLWLLGLELPLPISSFVLEGERRGLLSATVHTIQGFC